MDRELDLMLVGGGLASALIAWRLKRFRTNIRFLVIEENESFSEKETWCFHASDIEARELDWIFPLLSKSWPGYSVGIMDFQRSLHRAKYLAVRSQEFFQKIQIGAHVQFRTRVKSVSERGVYLQDGRFLSAKCVVDCRGGREGAGSPSGFHKFLSCEFELSSPHGMIRPRLMDAISNNRDGVRFLSVLPWTESTLTLECREFSANPGFSREEFRDSILAYARAMGWNIRSQIHESEAAIPVPILPGNPMQGLAAPTIGTRGGFSHPSTGASFPQAIRLAERISKVQKFDPANIWAITKAAQKELEKNREFCILLNRILFCAALPEERARIFTRLYRLPEPVLQRFFALKLNALDFARILLGRPPLPMEKAIKVIRPQEKLRLC